MHNKEQPKGDNSLQVGIGNGCVICAPGVKEQLAHGTACADVVVGGGGELQVVVHGQHGEDAGEQGSQEQASVVAKVGGSLKKVVKTNFI